ncbi:tetratricopeptide repeat protein [Gemmatimonadota bacterium]
MQQERFSALCDSGFVLLEQEEFESARSIFKEILDRNRNYPEALLGMGRAMLELPRGGGRALEYLSRAVAQTPESVDTHFHKARAHAHLARNGIVSRDDGRKALNEIEVVLAMNPSHAEAYFLRGQVYRDVFQEHGKAIEAFRFQFEVNPGHVAARTACMKAALDTGEWDQAIEMGENALSLSPDSYEIIPNLAAAYWKADRPDDSMDAFNRYFASVPEEERRLYFDLIPLLAPADMNEYGALDAEGRQSYWTQYWRARNPDPTTMVNERLLEHFIRVAWARTEFGQGTWPWDARGDFYVRYGEPDVRVDRNHPYATDLILGDWDYYIRKRDLYEELGLMRPTPPFESGFIDPYADLLQEVDADGSGTPEQWIYTERGIDVLLENPVMNGNFLVSIGSGPLVAAMELHKPVLSEIEESIEVFDPLQSAVTFRGQGGSTEMEYAIGLLPDHIGPFRSVSGEHAIIEAQIDLFTPGWHPAGQTSEQIRVFAARPQFTIRGNPVLAHNVTLSASPGDYLVSIMVMETVSGVRALAEERVSFPDYSGDDLMISDIMPAARITEVGPGQSGRFIKGDLEVIPLPGRMLGKDQPLFIYFEVYNLARDGFGGTRYLIEYSVSESRSDDGALRRLFQNLGALVGASGRPAVLSSEFLQQGVQRDIHTHLEIDLNAVPPGIYDLIVTITDQVSEQTVSQVLKFRTLPPMPSGRP